MLIVVLILGLGSNLQALIDAVPTTIPGKITHVISSSATAYGLTRAANAGIPTSTHTLKLYFAGIPKEDTAGRSAARAAFNIALAEKIIALGPTLVVCAGWMLILSPSFLSRLQAANIGIINLHPALPGAFDGTHAIERAYEAGKRGEVETGGVMVHWVVPEVDRGEPLVVKPVPFVTGESLEEYEARVHSTEWVAIVEGTVKALSG